MLCSEGASVVTSIAGLTRIAEGRDAEVFAWEPGVVLKLYRAGHEGSLGSESASMAAAKAAGAPVPAMLGMAEVDGRRGLLMERVDGADMLTVLGSKPWKLLRLGGTMGRAHAALHDAIAPPELPDLKQRLRAHMERSPLVPDVLRSRALAALASLPDGDRIVHGDFHPGNVIVTERGPIVIDWTNAVRGDAAADVARTLLTLRMGALPPGTPRLLGLLQNGGRSVLTWRYRAAYQALRPDDMRRASRWMLPVAIHRLTENIVEERAQLLRMIESGAFGA